MLLLLPHLPERIVLLVSHELFVGVDFSEFVEDLAELIDFTADFHVKEVFERPEV